MILKLDNHKAISLNQFYMMGHWAKRKKIADEVHSEIFWACREQKVKPIDKYPIRLEFKVGMKKMKDLDNVAIKLYIDGLRLAGILKDDNPHYIYSIHLEHYLGKSDWLKIICL